jgi:hypothetical protein
MSIRINRPCRLQGNRDVVRSHGVGEGIRLQGAIRVERFVYNIPDTLCTFKHR